MNPFKIHLNASLPLHKILSELLEKTGPATVYVSTFSISDESACMISALKDSGKITDLHCLIDYTMRKSRMDIVNFLGVISNELSLNHNHTKIILILNDKHKISFITSANFTENRRYEVGIEINLPEVAETLLQFMKTAINDGLPINKENGTNQRGITEN